MQRAGLVLGERLGRVEVQGAGGWVGDQHLERRQLEAQRLARGGAGGDDRRRVEGAQQRVALVQVELRRCRRAAARRGRAGRARPGSGPGRAAVRGAVVVDQALVLASGFQQRIPGFGCGAGRGQAPSMAAAGSASGPGSDALLAVCALVATVASSCFARSTSTSTAPCSARAGRSFAPPTAASAWRARGCCRPAHRADVEVVMFTGRAERGVDEMMRVLGQRSYIFELGCGIVIDGEHEWLTGDLVPSEERGTIFEQIEATGAPAAAARRRSPGGWSTTRPGPIGREVSHVFRGLVPADEASAVLEQAGFGWLRLVDNGVISGHGTAAERARLDDRRRARPLLPPDPQPGLQGPRGGPPHAEPRLPARRSASPAATRVRTWRPPTSSAPSG